METAATLGEGFFHAADGPWRVADTPQIAVANQMSM
jgi:hypothetical protein